MERTPRLQLLHYLLQTLRFRLLSERLRAVSSAKATAGSFRFRMSTLISVFKKILRPSSIISARRTEFEPWLWKAAGRKRVSKKAGACRDPAKNKRSHVLFSKTIKLPALLTAPFSQ